MMDVRRERRERRPEIRTLLSLGGLISLIVALGGCPKPAAKNDTADASATTSASVVAAMPPSDAGVSGGSPSKAGDSAGAFTGTYALEPAKLYINDSKDFANVKQAKDDPSKDVGEGAISITVDAEGKMTGTVDTGPASPGVIDGQLMEGSELRGVVRRKTPSDDGLTGTFVAKLAGVAVDGKLALAEANASILREGKVTLKKK